MRFVNAKWNQRLYASLLSSNIYLTLISHKLPEQRKFVGDSLLLKPFEISLWEPRNFVESIEIEFLCKQV